jgi:hypothetical protein
MHADHGEPAGISSFGRGVSPRPPIPCYDAAKDIVVPTPNVHFPRTPFAPALELGGQGAARHLLMFYAGWNYGERYECSMGADTCRTPLPLTDARCPMQDEACQLLSTASGP